MYRIEFSELAKEKFDKLSKTTRRMIVKKLVEIRGTDNPFRFFSPLRGVSARKARAGDYRIIADIDVRNKMIFVLTIGHRREIYKKLRRRRSD